jgi:uncharacterized DUF497 family protein
MECIWRNALWLLSTRVGPRQVPVNQGLSFRNTRFSPLRTLLFPRKTGAISGWGATSAAHCAAGRHRSDMCARIGGAKRRFHHARQAIAKRYPAVKTERMPCLRKAHYRNEFHPAQCAALIAPYRHETADGIRVISFRKANTREVKRYAKIKAAE